MKVFHRDMSEANVLSKAVTTIFQRQKEQTDFVGRKNHDMLQFFRAQQLGV